VRLKFLNLATEEAVKQLADGSIDLAVVREDAVARPMEFTPLGVLGYSLFIPPNLKSPAEHPSEVKWLDQLPLATLEGEGSFRGALAEIARKHKIKLNIQVECSSFPLAARAVSRGEVAAILPAIAAAELPGAAAFEAKLALLRHFDRKICLASNPRRVRIRPTLRQVRTTLAQLCSF